MENSNAILFYHSKTPLYQYTIPFYKTSTSQNSIFIKILFFNPFFIISSQPFNFLGFSTAIFIPLSQHRFNTQHTPIIHRSTYPNPSPHLSQPKPVLQDLEHDRHVNIKFTSILTRTNLNRKYLSRIISCIPAYILA